MIQEAIRNHFGSSGISVQFRTADRLLWQKACEELAYYPVDYTSAMIDYQLTYHTGSSNSATDLSVTFFHDNAPCGVWPLSFKQNERGESQIGSNGSNVLPPLFSHSMPAKLVRSMSTICIEVINILMLQLGEIAIISQSGFRDAPGLDDWHDKLLMGGAVAHLKHELFLDLDPEISDIKSSFRKSFKSLINSGSKLWLVGMMDCENSAVWEEFKELHRVVSGKITRSNESWQAQHEAIASGNAFFVSLRDKNSALVGGGLFHISRDEAVYAVGAYDRTLFEKPLGHVVQYRAIEEMKKRGIRWYKLGERFYSGDVPSPTEKEIRISEFKQGFANFLFPKYMITIRSSQS